MTSFVQAQEPCGPSLMVVPSQCSFFHNYNTSHHLSKAKGRNHWRGPAFHRHLRTFARKTQKQDLIMSLLSAFANRKGQRCAPLTFTVRPWTSHSKRPIDCRDRQPGCRIND